MQVFRSIQDDDLVRSIVGATRRLVFVAPGVSAAVAVSGRRPTRWSPIIRAPNPLRAAPSLGRPSRHRAFGRALNVNEQKI